MEDPWGIEGSRGGEKPNIKQIVKKKKKKKTVKKFQKLAKSGKKSEKSDFFFFFLTENGLKCIRNPTKHL